ncbi:DUF3787 domain-containing protein [Eubacteriales bacterium OttesenSCG-928-M02]|nr:DUF3787 domain-containing protein [Eubacteriales bacterium OttesenSCG-928-M02]
MKKKKKNRETTVPLGETMPLTNAQAYEGEGNIPLPSEENIEAAREWVEDNELR